MRTTVGPLTAAGMPLQRVPNGFLAKRMRLRAVDGFTELSTMDARDSLIAAVACRAKADALAGGYANPSLAASPESCLDL